MFSLKTLMSAVLLSFPVVLYPPLSEIIAPGHQWESFDARLLFHVNSVNYKNATFAGILKNGTIYYIAQNFYSKGNTVPMKTLLGGSCCTLMKISITM